MRAALLLTGVLVAAPGLAQEPTPSPSPQDPAAPVKREEVVVVTASKVESSIVNAPATVSVVSAETIAAAPAQNYGDLLRGVPGLNVIQMSARDVNLTARQATGTIATSQLALVDGRSIYLDFFGVILWDTIPIQFSEIKQIEIVRGPASAVWGANALTGVVNIITKSPREMAGTSVILQGGAFSVDAGSKEGEGAGYSGGVEVRLARVASDVWSYKLSAGYFGSDAFARPTGRIPVVPDPRTPGAFVGGATYPLDAPGLSGGTGFENEGTRQPKLDLRLDQELSNGGRLSYTAGVAGSNGIVHSGIGPFRIEDNSYFGYGRVSYRKGSLGLAAFTNIVDAKAPSLLATDPFTGQAVLLNFKTQSYDLELSDARVLGGKHVLSYGGNVRRNNFEISLAPGGEDRTELGAYVQDEIFFDRFRLTVGGRVDKFGNIESAVFSPRVSAMVKPAEDHSFRVSFNRAFRSPSVVNNFLDQAIVTPVDLSALAPLLPPVLQPAVRQPFPLVVRAVGKEDLEEESLTAYEVGYTGTFGGDTTVSVAYYINDVDQNINFVTLPARQDPDTVQNPPPFWTQRGLPPALIGLLQQGGVFLPRTAFQYLNLGPVRNKGLELALDHRLTNVLGAFANYSWQDDPQVLDDPEPFPREEIALPPRHRLNAGLSLSGQRYLGSLSVNYTSRAFWSDVLTPAYHGFTDAFTLVSGSFGVRWAGGRVTTTLKATNLLDEEIQQHVFGDILRRSVTAEVRFDF
ncbi:MAG TPA: TonB-dependent receptor [Vicinamibacteria bacterium]|nr:TonB-dependent receptor [Vicinamibacteria bacterium]